MPKPERFWKATKYPLSWKNNRMTGKIIKGIAGFYYVHDKKSRIYECRAKGIFRNRKVKPLVGDDVEFTVLDDGTGEGNIDTILPRKNQLIRPASANVDQALVVFAITHPEPNRNLLDRFLVMMGTEKIPVIICFNKVDLCGRELSDVYQAIYEPAGYQTVFVSTYEGTGMENLRQLLRGKTTVLAGPSGVGKSSLTNLLLPEAAMETGDISEKIQRGRHTTRHSQLFCVEENTYLMDTPGFSFLTLDMEPQKLKEYFAEFTPYEEDCKFLGCVHVGEKICGVKEALKSGKVSKSRYSNYLQIYEELKEKERRKY